MERTYAVIVTAAVASIVHVVLVHTSLCCLVLTCWDIVGLILVVLVVVLIAFCWRRCVVFCFVYS